MLRQIVIDFFKDTVAAHKRRVANRRGNREPETKDCKHIKWNDLRNWCEDCGMTAFELQTHDIGGEA